jgi:hypothetical protein
MSQMETYHQNWASVSFDRLTVMYIVARRIYLHVLALTTSFFPVHPSPENEGSRSRIRGRSVVHIPRSRHNTRGRSQGQKMKKGTAFRRWPRVGDHTGCRRSCSIQSHGKHWSTLGLHVSRPNHQSTRTATFPSLLKQIRPLLQRVRRQGALGMSEDARTP